MGIESPNNTSPTKQEVNVEAWKANVNTLIELFQLNERGGKYNADERITNSIESVIQRHTTSAEGGFNHISDPETYTRDLISIRDALIAEKISEPEKQKVRELFKLAGAELAD